MSVVRVCESVQRVRHDWCRGTGQGSLPESVLLAPAPSGLLLLQSMSRIGVRKGLCMAGILILVTEG